MLVSDNESEIYSPHCALGHTTDANVISETINNFLSTIGEKLKSEHPQENPEFDTINLDDYIWHSSTEIGESYVSFEGT